MEHPGPGPHSSQPPLLPQPSHSVLVLDTQSQPGPRSPPPTSAPVVSLFDNVTFSLQQIQTDQILDPKPTDQTGMMDLQFNQTADTAVGAG